MQNSGRMKSRHTILKGDSKPCPKRLYNLMRQLSRDILLKIADYLDCDIEDLCEFIKTEDLEDNKITKGMGR